MKWPSDVNARSITAAAQKENTRRTGELPKPGPCYTLDRIFAHTYSSYLQQQPVAWLCGTNLCRLEIGRAQANLNHLDSSELFSVRFPLAITCFSLCVSSWVKGTELRRCDPSTAAVSPRWNQENMRPLIFNCMKSFDCTNANVPNVDRSAVCPASPIIGSGAEV